MVPSLMEILLLIVIYTFGGKRSANMALIFAPVCLIFNAGFSRVKSKSTCRFQIWGVSRKDMRSALNMNPPSDRGLWPRISGFLIIQVPCSEEMPSDRNAPLNLSLQYFLRYSPKENIQMFCQKIIPRTIPTKDKRKINFFIDIFSIN